MPGVIDLNNNTPLLQSVIGKLQFLRARRGRFSVSSWVIERFRSARQAIHVAVLVSIVVAFQNIVFRQWAFEGASNPGQDLHPAVYWVILVFRLMPFLALPQAILNFLGLICFNAFPERVKLKGSPLLAPFICIRVVTRGDFPGLVRENMDRNLATCQRVGLEKFMIEVVTDKEFEMTDNPRFRQVVVPNSYQSQSGALFKARALQYCLEDPVNVLSDQDWIVHLDEESLLTESAVRGILNFVMDGKHNFGQGLITYANESIQNWLTTLADSFRVSDDLGKLKFQLKVFHKPVLGWKGSYVVSQVEAERRVSFDHGPDGSVAEDNFFGMVAMQDGYTFDFIEGEVWEKSPFTIGDFLQQRKRWLQGLLLIVHSSRIHLRTKLALAVSVYSWVTMPLGVVSVVASLFASAPSTAAVEAATAFVSAVTAYMFVFGVVRSFRLDRLGAVRLALSLAGAVVVMPFSFAVENAAVVLGLFGRKHKFYVVNKVVESKDRRGTNSIVDIV